MEVPDGWASDESEVSEVSDGGLGSGFCLDHPVDHAGALTETAFARAAGRASLAGATEVEIAFDAFERLACAGRAFPELQPSTTRARAREVRGETRAVERTREWARALRRAELETRLAKGATRFCRALGFNV